MTDIELLTILESPRSNLEKAIAIRAALKAAQPSALDIKPIVQRKKREKPQHVQAPPTKRFNSATGEYEEATP